jgi:hypothetical protein
MSREPTTLRDWFMSRVRSRSRDRYAGVVTGTDRPDHTITTSPIASIDGDLVTTRSGSVYRIDGPDRWGRRVSLADFDHPFYLDTDGAETWPPGSVVPPMEDDDV